MKKDINQLVESFFAKKENVLTANLLEELVRAQFLLNEEANFYAGDEVPFQKGYPAGKEMSVKFSFIPDLSVSELGWSSLETADGNPSPQRRQLEEYLKNIPGQTFKDKVQKINEFYNTPPEQLEKMGFFKNESGTRSGKIQQIISYLVFLKTLTTIITNFNAASAGFAFEAFLGVLLGGSQVKANTGTIADLTAPDPTVEGGKVHISLKLYSEKGVHVGGSFTDLAVDLAGDTNGKKQPVPAIRYIIAVKSLKGEKLDLAGEISIYQFDITKENIFTIMNLAGGESKDCIRLPERYISSNGNTDFQHLKISQRPDEVVGEFFNEDMEKAFLGRNAKMSKEEYSEFIDVIEGLLEDAGLWSGVKDEDPKLGIHYPNERKLTPALEKVYSSGSLTYQGQAPDKKTIKNEIVNTLIACYKRAVSYRKGEEVAIGQALKEGKQTEVTEIAPNEPLASTEASIAYYNNPKTDKAKALRNTYGYLKVKQFGMTKNQMFDLLGKTGQGSETPIAKLIIGKANVEGLLNKLTSDINQEVFEIFDSLSLLTSNINTYFATGLKNDAAAQTAQTAANNIEKKTETVQAKAKEKV